MARNEALETDVVIYMDDYRKAQTAKLAVVCSEEQLLCVNWNPAFGPIALFTYQTAQELSPQLPDDNAVVQPEFLNRVYALASQI